MVVGHGRAAFYVKQGAIPGITNLTREQAEGVDL